MTGDEGRDLFDGCRAKIARAEELRDAIREEFIAWARDGEDGSRFVIQYASAINGNADVVLVRLMIEDPIPLRFSVMAGDFFHNLRSALDHVIARLKEAHGERVTDAHFPVAVHVNEYPNFSTRYLAGIPEGSPARAIIESVQPFHHSEPGNHPLRVIQRMNNDDKHELVHVTAVALDADDGLDIVQVLEPLDIADAKSLWTRGDALDDGTPLAAYRLKPGARARDVLSRRPNVMTRLRFGTDGDTATLDDCIEAVREIMDAVAALDPTDGG